jgi:hypothetical protein
MVSNLNPDKYTLTFYSLPENFAAQPATAATVGLVQDEPRRAQTRLYIYIGRSQRTNTQRERRLQRSKWRPSLSDTSHRIELLAFCQMYGGCNGKLLHRYRGLGMADIWSRKLEV